MLDIREYIIPQSLEEAAALVRKSPANRIVGGGCWLRMERRPYGTWVDLSALGLDQIHAEDGWVQIGSGCTLRMLEVSELLRDTFGSCFADCVSSIVGVQFRNCATVGGAFTDASGFRICVRSCSPWRRTSFSTAGARCPWRNSCERRAMGSGTFCLACGFPRTGDGRLSPRSAGPPQTCRS